MRGIERQFFWSFARLSWVLYFDYFWSWWPINENTLTGLRPVFLLFLSLFISGPPLAPWHADLPPLKNKSLFPWYSGYLRQLPLLCRTSPSQSLLFSPKLSWRLGWRKPFFLSCQFTTPALRDLPLFEYVVILSYILMERVHSLKKSSHV